MVHLGRIDGRLSPQMIHGHVMRDSRGAPWNDHGYFMTLYIKSVKINKYIHIYIYACGFNEPQWQ